MSQVSLDPGVTNVMFAMLKQALVMDLINGIEAVTANPKRGEEVQDTIDMAAVTLSQETFGGGGQGSMLLGAYKQVQQSGSLGVVKVMQHELAALSVLLAVA